jgi:type IV secretory pathway TraG/TraD family ATPase VirD4
MANLDWRHDPSLWMRPGDLPARPPRLSPGIHGNARLANRRDLTALLRSPEWGSLFIPEATLLVEDAEDGSQLAPCLHSGLHLPADWRERHVLAIGSTGCGKTQKLILTQLAADMADPERTIIALDAKGGVLPGYVQALARRFRPEQTVRVVNFKSTTRTTHRWNPAQRIASRHLALEIAHAVCSNVEDAASESRTNEAFWLFSSINLLADVLRLLADDPREISSLARAKQVIDNSAYDLAVLSDNHPFKNSFEQRYPALRRYLDGSSNVTQQSIIADCAMRMTLFSDEAIARTTSGADELDVRGLIREGGVLILEIPEAHAKQLTPLTNLFVTLLLGALLDESMESPGGRLERPCSVILDELGSACGRLPEFETRLATLRSRGVAITGAVQSLRQLEHLYGASASVADGFSTKLFFGGALSPTDAKLASELAGTCTVVCETHSVSKAPDGQVTQSRSRGPAARPVLLPDEVSRPAVHPLLGPPVTVFTPNTPPFYAYLVPAYERQELAACLAEGERAERQLQEQLRQMRAEIRRLKGVLGWEALRGEAFAWWHEVEARGEQGLHEMLRALESLGAGWLEECAKSVNASQLPESFHAWMSAPQTEEAVPSATLTASPKTSLSKRIEGQKVYLVRGRDRGRDAWYYVLVNKKPQVVFEKDLKRGSVVLTDYGDVLMSGWGKDPTPEASRRAREEWGFQGNE